MNREFDGYENEDNRSDNGRTERHCRNTSGENSGEKNDACKDSHIKNWHPDYSLSSPHAREWHKQNEKSKHQAIDVKDGTYTVKHGDALSTIAARELKAEGKHADKKAIANEVKEIVALNHEKYSALDCNKEFLGTGWKLKMPHHKGSSGHSGDSPTIDSPPSARPPVDLPPTREQYDPPQVQSVQGMPPEQMPYRPAPPTPAVFEQQRTPQPFDQQSQLPMQMLGQVLQGITGGNRGFGNFGSPEYGQFGGDRLPMRLAEDLLNGNVQDAVNVIRAEMVRGNLMGAIQQANQVAEQTAAQQGMRSPLRIGIERDGDIDLIDQFGRRVARAGNVYGRGDYDGFQQQRYLQQQFHPQQYFQPQQHFQSPVNWRAGYGPSGSVMSTLQDRNAMLQQEAMNHVPQRHWQPNMNNGRRWGDQFDDPGMNQALRQLQRFGLPKI